MAATRLVALIDTYKDRYGTPDSVIAGRIGITKQNLSLWRRAGLRALPSRVNLEALAAAINTPYRTVLDAALHDTGYLPPSTGPQVRAYTDVLSDAVAVLTEATRLTNQRVRRTADGGWEPDPGSAEPIDWAAFVTDALAGAAANAGSIDTVLAGRPGSWEADSIGQILCSTVGDDEMSLLACRTEPVNVVLRPDQILADTGHADAYDAAELELLRREDTILPHSPDSVPTATDEQDIALDAIADLRERLEAQQQSELSDYGQQLAAAVTERLEALHLPVPVTVTVDLDTDPATWNEEDFHAPGFTTNIIDQTIADAIMATPSILDGDPLERAEADLEQNGPDTNE